MSAYEWHPPDRDTIAWKLAWYLDAYHVETTTIDGHSFPVLYNTQVGKEGSSFEVLPGLWGRVTNYYVTHPDTYHQGSEVYILCSDAKDWLAEQQQA